MVSSFRTPSSAIGRPALTLVEMLIGLAITLLMMAAVVSLFANIGAGVRVRQATIEMSAELRDVRAKLYKDLTHATCRTLPWQRPDEDPGYFEIVEGMYSDRLPSGQAIDFRFSQIPGSQDPTLPSFQDPNTGDITDGTGLGDYDDIIALTVRQKDIPFQGRFVDPNTFSPETIESSVAEVIWFAIENKIASPGDEQGMRKVYRRQLIVAPWVDLSGIAAPTSISLAEYERFYSQCDISVHIEPTGSGFAWVPNSLGDLAKRENRFGHYFENNFGNQNGYPHRFPHDGNGNLVLEAGAGTSLRPFDGDRAGEDLIIENVLAFDVLVFDPGAPLFEYAGQIVEPVDNTDPRHECVSGGHQRQTTRRFRRLCRSRLGRQL